MTKPIKPYYRRGTKYFFRYGKKKWWFELIHVGKGVYQSKGGGDNVKVAELSMLVNQFGAHNITFMIYP